MKKALVSLFGLSVLLGNVCLMDASFAAGPATGSPPMMEHAAQVHHAVRSTDSCTENVCLEPDAGENAMESDEPDCTEGQCVRGGAQDGRASFLAPLSVPEPDTTGFIDTLITQALLITGPRPFVQPVVERGILWPIMTVVMRQ
ncbi:MAG: hypothetical protein WCV62_06615 [Candidatus Peribacteraceae bacterium]|jgi:hypothetical protein